MTTARDGSASRRVSSCWPTSSLDDANDGQSTMSWIEHHEISERLASQAEAARLDGRREEAPDLYARAAEAEEKALADLDTSKTRTAGISAVSAVSLYYKAARFANAETLAIRWLGFDSLPAFAKEQLRSLLQSIWSEQVRDSVEAQFAPGQVLVSVDGPEIVPGGAPLDLIVDKVRAVQSILHRTAEFLGGLEHRKRGAPSRNIQDSCRPWLFQAPPGHSGRRGSKERRARNSESQAAGRPVKDPTGAVTWNAPRGPSGQGLA